jgi:hypothetical protein
MKVGFTVMIQKQSNNHRPQSPRAKKGAAGVEFNKEHVHCSFF